MRIAIFVYDHMTALDATGPHEVLSRLPGSETVFVGVERGIVRCDSGLGLVADAGLRDVPWADIVLIPGWSGAPQADLLRPGPVHEWVRSIDRTSTWTTSTCTGSVILAAAGVLRGRPAATHWIAADELVAFGAVPSNERVVVDGKYVTAAGGTAGIDMALRVAALVSGESAAAAIQLGIEYDPQPPFDSGSPTTAPAHLVEAMRAVKDFIVYGGRRSGDA